MKKSFSFRNSSISVGDLFQVVWTLSICILAIIFMVTGNRAALMGTFFWAVVFLVLFMCRPGSKLHEISMDSLKSAHTRCILFVMVLTILICIYPMSESPLWNGEVPGHRNQYELMAEALLDGRIHLDYGDEEGLLALENPYDPQERKDSDVTYHWDHAWYDGHYYMYFGIVPVLLVFLPFRILTGTALTTYHATQLFAALTIAGLFWLFRLMAKRFFKDMSLGLYISMATVFSVVSIWFSMAQPSLYCTAITAALSLQVWSLYFFANAVWVQTEEKHQLIYAGIGALLGALVFGCRPTIGLANLLVVPMLMAFLNQHELTPKLLGKLVLTAMPYVVVAVALMLYNYVRFDDPFEFGQTYQLTVADQTSLGDVSGITVRLRLINETYQNFFGITFLSEQFPYIGHSGVFVNFPMLLLCFGLFRRDVRTDLKEKGLTLFSWCLFLLPILITWMAILWSPYLLERYRMDIYFLICILCFLVAGSWYQKMPQELRRGFGSTIMVLSVMTLLACLALHLVSVRTFQPERMPWIEQLLLFWKHL